MRTRTIEELSPLESELLALYEVCIMGKVKLEIFCGSCSNNVSLKLNGYPSRCRCPICKIAMIVDEVNENTTEGIESGYIVYAFPERVLTLLDKSIDEVFTEYKAGRMRFTGDLKGIQFVTE